MSTFDLLRLPPAFDPTASAYKDWFHLNLFDHATGTVGLVNVSLHGDPVDRRARAVGTALFHVPGASKTGASEARWHGGVGIGGFADATILPHGIMGDGAAIMVDPTREKLHASVEMAGEGLSLRVAGSASATPLAFDQARAFGSGWIRWFVAPRVALSGSIAIGEATSEASSWSAYHDHNWGRWFWGEDIGWEWGAFVAQPTDGAQGPVFVIARVTDKLHRRGDLPHLFAIGPWGVRAFPAGTVRLVLEGRCDLPLRRLPGALAALFPDRAEPDLPRCVEIIAEKGLDRLALRFTAEGAAQLIEGEPMRAGYGFIHELVGGFETRGTIREQAFETSGLGVFEYVT